MKFSKSALVLAACALFALPLTAEEKPLSFGLSVDFAYYPKAEKVETGLTNDVSRFAPTTGVYNNLEGRINVYGSYKIPTPLGKHWLVKDANVEVTETLEITPISVAPSTSISFTPVPFIVLNAGFKVGTGWELIGMQGMSIYAPTLEDTTKYDNLTPFGSLFSKYWAQGTFQFDTGAIIDDDWAHVQTMYTYQVYYEGMTGAADQYLWCWQATSNKVNGVKEYMNAILAYQMPLVISRVGFIFESDRYLNPKAYANDSYVSDFREMNLSAMSQFTFTEKDVLTVLLNFANRRTFNVYNDKIPESYLSCSGSEWFFKRIAFSYSHKF